MKWDQNWKKYLKIFGLRNHAVMSGVPVSEIVYVHSKLIIIDDEKCLIGSANINDRSMLGYRDSEIAMVTEQENKVEGILAGEKFMKSPAIREFRINAWKTLFCLDIDYEDPLSLEF